jgi:DNA repair protein RadD
VGRGLRTAEGKTDCLILDHSDNHLRLGFVDEIHYDELDDGEHRRQQHEQAETLPKKCIKCSFLKPPKMLQCPCCGFIPTPQPGAVHRDGELIELVSRSRAASASVDDRMDFYAELKRIQETRDYRPGWTAHKFKEKFGHFPPFDFNHMPSRTPSAATMRWVQSRNIAWAKSRHRGVA